VDPETRHRVLSALGVVERKFNKNQLRDPHTGEWIDMPGVGGVAHALADIVDDTSFESLNDNEVYVGIRADGIMDLGIGTEKDSPVTHFSRHDAEAIHEAGYALWRKRGDDPIVPDENGAGLIDDTIVETDGGRIYLAISEGVTWHADPDDPDEEDEYGPVLTLGIPTAKDSADKPDFHEVDLDEDGFDSLFSALENFRADYEPAEVETHGVGDLDIALMADHTIQFQEGGINSDAPALRVDEAERLAATIERLLKVDLPDAQGDPDDLDVHDGDDINADFGVSLMTDGSFTLNVPSGSIEYLREDAEQLADVLRELIHKDHTAPGGAMATGRGSGERIDAGRSLRRHRVLVALGVVERKFNINQPRDPGGEGGGQWGHHRWGDPRRPQTRRKDRPG